MKVIKASELGTYLYCRRAWWYRRQGVESSNQNELQAGETYHHQHSSKVWQASLLRLAGWLFVILAMILFVIYITLSWL